MALGLGLPPLERLEDRTLVAYSVITLAGAAGAVGTADGTGAAARFNMPEDVAVNSAGTTIYVSDTGNDTIREMTQTAAGWKVTTLAGTPGSTDVLDSRGPIAVDPTGNVYEVDNPLGTGFVHMIARDGTVTLLTVGGYGTTGIAVNSAGTALYLSSLAGGQIEDFTKQGDNWQEGLPLNIVNASLEPGSLALDSAGNLYVVNGGAEIDKLTPNPTNDTWTQTTFADVGFGAEVEGIAVDSAGNVYATEYDGTIAEISPAGVVTTLVVGSAGPQGVAVDSAGNVYVAVAGNDTIGEVTMKISPPTSPDLPAVSFLTAEQKVFISAAGAQIAGGKNERDGESVTETIVQKIAEGDTVEGLRALIEYADDTSTAKPNKNFSGPTSGTWIFQPSQTLIDIGIAIGKKQLVTTYDQLKKSAAPYLTVVYKIKDVVGGVLGPISQTTIELDNVAFGTKKLRLLAKAGARLANDLTRQLRDDPSQVTQQAFLNAVRAARTLEQGFAEAASNYNTVYSGATAFDKLYPVYLESHQQILNELNTLETRAINHPEYFK